MLNSGMLWIGRQILHLLRLHLDGLSWQHKILVQTQKEVSNLVFYAQSTITVISGRTHNIIIHEHKYT